MLIFLLCLWIEAQEEELLNDEERQALYWNWNRLKNINKRNEIRNEIKKLRHTKQYKEKKRNPRINEYPNKEEENSLSFVIFLICYGRLNSFSFHFAIPIILISFVSPSPHPRIFFQ